MTLSAVLIAQIRAQPNIAGADEIKLTLGKLRVLGSALMIAAHPDDENTGVLAYLARGRKIRTAYLSLTRGEGGQNLIGSEQGDALGVIRTQELLAARRIDGAQQFFTRAIDFGFSKSPQESISKWGHDEVLSDIVWVIRKYQPDVVILRFSGTPRDGHGQHQASAILGKEAYEAAADPSRFPEQLRWAKPWRAKRLVWNAFAFTPEQEREAAKIAHRIQVDAGAFDPLLGYSFGEIAGISRSQHRSQGMGAPQQRGPSINYFTPVSGDTAEKDLFDGVDTSWKRVPGGEAIGNLLARADAAYDPAHPEKIIGLLAEARRTVAALADSGNPWASEKLPDLDHAIELCGGFWIDAASEGFSFTPGSEVSVTVTVIQRASSGARWNTVAVAGFNQQNHQDVGTALSDNVPVTRKLSIAIPSSEGYTQPFWLKLPHKGFLYDIRDQQLIGRAAPTTPLTADLGLEIGGARLQLSVPVHYRYVDHVRGELTRPLEIVPPVAVDLPETAVIFPSNEPKQIVVQIRANSGPVDGDVRLEVPDGWKAATKSAGFHLTAAGAQEEVAFEVTPPPTHHDVAAFRAVATVNGREVDTGMQSIAYEHIPPQTIFLPSRGKLERFDVSLLSKNIGYIMGAGDGVPESIRQMGGSVTLLTEEDLARGDLSRYDVIVTGVRAYNVRPDLRAAETRLLAYVQNGGALVVQYNVLEFARFGGPALPMGQLGPYPFQISRDRVVEEDSPVKVLDPMCSLLREPNEIGESDFKGWIQERGLYFAEKWDPRYGVVIATHDTGEKDLPGGMLFAKYGKGIYIFTAYSWFRELPAGVPGAYRIFANLLSAGKALK